MGSIVEFASNGKRAQGYLALPAEVGPGIVVIQEWWGLVDHIKDVCDRFAAEGFVALAPDLYHGKTTKEPDEAGKLMMELNTARAAKDMSGAVSFLRSHERVAGGKVGCTGFCMGGAMTLVLASIAPIDAAVPFYGIPPAADYGRIACPVLGHFAEHDGWADPAKGEELFASLRARGLDATLHVYPGTEHAFFNDSRPEVYSAEAATKAWERTVAFLREHLG